jgi:hypothetical protein
VRRFVQLTALALCVGSLAPLVTNSSGASTLHGSNQFCKAEALLYASPSQLAALWPDVTSTPSAAQANDMVNTLLTIGYHQFGALAVVAPTEILKAQLTAADAASVKQFQEATRFGPSANASHTAAAEKGYTTLIERSARTVKGFLSSEAALLVGYCFAFNDTHTTNGVAVQTTNIAQAISHDDATPTVTAAILAQAASTVGHYVVFVSLTGHGGAQKAHYRVAAITTMVNACTTVPPSIRTAPTHVPC